MRHWRNLNYKLAYLKFSLIFLISKFILLNSVIRIWVALRYIGCKTYLFQILIKSYLVVKRFIILINKNHFINLNTLISYFIFIK